MKEAFPEQYQILPAPVERGLEVIQRLGRFLAPQHTELCLSEHIRHEPTDGEPIEQYVQGRLDI